MAVRSLFFSVTEIFRDLLKPENRAVLFVLIAIFVAIDAYLIYLIKGGWLVLKLPWFSLKKAKSKDGKVDRFAYRKLLYVKVTHLSDQTKSPTPFYRRSVKRLKEADRQVPVFDEAVYYTLELFPKKKRAEPRKERSSGVVDARLVIPWQDDVQIRDEGARAIKEWVQLESDEETDVFLSISHFENGLQGAGNDIGTDVREDAEWVRVVVDFSSVPNAAKFITAPKAVLKDQGHDQLVPIAVSDKTVFTALCCDVKKDTSIVLFFEFDWDRNR